MRLEFIPKEMKEEKSSQEVLIPLNAIELDPLSLRRTYGVSLFYGKDKLTKIQYKIDLIYKKETEDENFIIEIQKQELYINEKRVSSSVDLLMEKCGEVLYPLEISVNKNLKFLEIANHSTIVKRWEYLKKEIKKSFEGNFADSIIDETSKILSDSDAIKRKLVENDWFYILFFNPVGTRNFEQHLPLIANKRGIAYTFRNTAHYHIKRKRDIVIHKQGTCTDERSEQEIFQGKTISNENENQVSGKSNFTYQIFRGSNLVDVIIGEVELRFPSNKKEFVKVEIFNLRNEIPKTNQEKANQKDQELEKDIKEKKKKKKYFLFGKEIKI
ncbi:hypothetical protein [uncultured Aquimarina sp.]|uniref:hypothetical protein n=2 Tax=uncultured Aquimarina sp. TaxID=575652 RepID=UPI002612788A|nr:hypothetical protein [uncultured Aquimarina sp.]